jgi:hypothetical protein
LYPGHATIIAAIFSAAILAIFGISDMIQFFECARYNIPDDADWGSGVVRLLLAALLAFIAAGLILRNRAARPGG